MIVYADSSSIVTLYMEEGARSRAVRALRDRLENMLASSRVAYAEVRSALARGRREKRFQSEADYRRAIRDFNRDWRRYFLRMSLLERGVRLAGDLAETHALKGYDAVHLASALTLKQRIGTQVGFSTWDKGLRRAASAAGLATPH